VPPGDVKKLVAAFSVEDLFETSVASGPQQSQPGLLRGGATENCIVADWE
jgi:hypothetical protein